MKKIILILLALCMLAGCASKTVPQEEVSEVNDLDGYQVEDAADDAFFLGLDVLFNSL